MKEKLFLKCYQALLLLVVSFFITACGGDNVTPVASAHESNVSEEVPSETSNKIPVATAQSVTVDEDTTNNIITLSGADADGDPLTYAIVTQPAHGSVTIVGAVATYIPIANYAGADAFTFRVNDGIVDSAIETVKITVTDVAEPIVKDTKPWNHGKLEVSSDGHMLQHEDGKGFFWMADTAWNILLKMNREELERYLTDRASKGFTVIQTGLMSEPYLANAYGDQPFSIVWNDENNHRNAYRINELSTTPGMTISSKIIDATDGYDYWDHVDYLIDKAAQKGIYIGMMLTWSTPVHDFIQKDETVYSEYAEFLAERYKDKPNIIWMNGGDIFHADIKDSEVWDWLGDTIKAIDNNHLMSWHSASSADFHHAKEWLDFNMIESGHIVGLDSLNHQNDMLKKDYGRVPSKPIVDAETRYEEIEIGLLTGADRITPFDVREIAYYQLFSGAFGHTYGHNSIWQVITENKQGDYHPISTWEEALEAPGADQMHYISNLMQSRPIVGRVPDQSLIASGDTVKIRATRGDGYAFIYSTSGKNLEIQLGKISGSNVKIWSYNPRDGKAIVLEESLPNIGKYTFNPEGEEEYGNDWVVVVDDLSRGYGKPGE